MDTPTAMTELTENRDIAPLFVEADPADAVLADSDIPEGVAPSATRKDMHEIRQQNVYIVRNSPVNELPHAELNSLAACEGIEPGKSLFTML